MNRKMDKSNTYKELLFHTVVYFIVFLFSSFDRNNPQIEFNELVFFLNYAFAASMINFYLFPRFFYKKKYLQFAIYVLLLLTAVLLIEELVIEKIFFPDTRGSKFSNVLYTLIDIIPPIIILSGFKFAWDAVARQKQLDELKIMVKESELQFLKTQINPHFLFNNLNNLYALAVEESKKTPEVILALSSLLRYMLYECKAAYVPLSKEIVQLQNFIELGEMQIEGRGAVRFTNSIPTQQTLQIAPLILVVFIENAFKHSSSSTTDAISINIISSISSEGTLQFLCKNTFQHESNTTSLSQGIGLQNVKKRLDLIYPNLYQLDISNTETEFTVQLELQLNT